MSTPFKRPRLTGTVARITVVGYGNGVMHTALILQGRSEVFTMKSSSATSTYGKSDDENAHENIVLPALTKEGDRVDLVFENDLDLSRNKFQRLENRTIQEMSPAAQD